MSYPISLDLGTHFTKTRHSEGYPEIDPVTKSNHSGHYIFITGASKGCGRATAISFAKAGAAGIAIGARSSLDDVEIEMIAAAKAAGKPIPKILKFSLDLMTWSDVVDAAKTTEQEFGRLDILINNAGYLSKFQPIHDTDKDEWWRNQEINIRGVYWMSKALLPLMLKGGEKTIVNLSSVGANRLDAFGASGYCVAKFALHRFTECLMVDYAKDGLIAYCAHPGGILTELSSGMPAAVHPYLTDKPEICGDTLAFLTAERREWLAGRYIACTWDMPEFLSREEEIVKENKLVFRMKF
ncbi:hypothetical protein BGZ60DRAFT_553679 [Tricladium varicosporioides]|nr:hypothetical protein BGZ60DRAFT_553679 [Hymenoscyphus varicosporioides]